MRRGSSPQLALSRAKHSAGKAYRGRVEAALRSAQLAAKAAFASSLKLAMQAPVATRARTAAPTRRTDAPALRDFHCFQPDGGAPPRLPIPHRLTDAASVQRFGASATPNRASRPSAESLAKSRRQTWAGSSGVAATGSKAKRAASSSGAIRRNGELNTQSHWASRGEVTETPPTPSRMGRTFVTPPPPQPQSYVQLTDAQRRRPSPAPFSAAPPPPAVKGALPLSPTSSPIKKRTHAESSQQQQQQQQQTAQEVIDSFEEVELSDFEPDDDGNDDDQEDEIRDDDDERSPWTASPPKKARFDSFTGPVSPRTPSKHNAAGPPAPSPSSSTFAAIRADPDSPFHAIQRSLFSTTAAATTENTTSPTPPTPSGPTSSQFATASTHNGDAFSSLAGALAPLAALLDAAQKERDKDARLLLAARRKEETLRRSYEKERDERERLRKENEGLKNRIK